MEMAMNGKAETVTTIDLGHEQLFLFDGGAGARVRVLYGATWLTEEGQPGDAIVGAGDEVPLHGGRTLIEGLRASRVQIVGPARTGLAHRVGRRLRAAARHAWQRLERFQLGAGGVIESNG
jgi:hypothetical protein